MPLPSAIIVNHVVLLFGGDRDRSANASAAMIRADKGVYAELDCPRYVAGMLRALHGDEEDALFQGNGRRLCLVCRKLFWTAREYHKHHAVTWFRSNEFFFRTVGIHSTRSALFPL